MLDELPCAILVTDNEGYIEVVNAALLALLGGSAQSWQGRSVETLFPPAGRLFLQTHVWPTLLREGSFSEIYLQVLDAQSKRIPVLVNARKGENDYYWTLFVAQDRTRFEAELLSARNRAESMTKQLEKSEQFIKSVTASIPDLISYWDKDLLCRFANKAYLEWFGKAPEALLGSSLFDLLEGGLYPLHEEYIRGALAGQRQQFERAITRTDGQIGHTQANYVPDIVDGEVVGFLASVTDITTLKNTQLALQTEIYERRQMMSELAEQHELLRVTLQSIGDAVITTDAAGIINWINPVAERMTGWLAKEALGRPLPLVFNIIHEETRQPAENPAAICMEQIKVVGIPNNTVLISRMGEEFGIEDSAAPIRNAQGELLGVVLVFHDVTEQRHISGEMSYRATHDALTELINRSEFEARLRRILSQCHEDDSQHTVLFIDLDQFKLVNDTCGHAIGDQLLQQVAKLFGQIIRDSDTLARLGGDEFGVILEHCTAEQAQRVGQKICERMDAFRFVHDDHRFRIGTSIGLVPVNRLWSTTAAIIQAADSACYAAKEAGRNRVHTWFDTDQAMQARHYETQWASRLEQAIDENCFVLYAQRLEALSLGTQGVYAEVLLRMLAPDGSLVQPGAFLPAAERFHLASRIDRWVLRRTIDTLLALTDLTTINTLCINLSGQSIGDRAFHREAMEILTQAGPAICQRICLELTETAAVTNMADAAVFIDQAHALGIRIALDDFGAGVSSFGYLKNLSVDIIKIDGQFIRNITQDPLNDATVRCFVDVARVVGLKTVAEFVDTLETQIRIREIGVDFAQGYLLHRPESLENIL